MWGRKPGIFNQGLHILFGAVYILHIQETHLCRVNTWLFLLQCWSVYRQILKDLLTLFQMQSHKTHSCGEHFYFWASTECLNVPQRISPSASLLNLYLGHAISTPMQLHSCSGMPSWAPTNGVIRKNSKGKWEWLSLLCRASLRSHQIHTLTLLANILHSCHQLLLQELALLCNFVSFLQEILCCLLDWSSQDMSLFRTASLFIGGALVAGVNQCCYLKAQMEGKKPNIKFNIYPFSKKDSKATYIFCLDRVLLIPALLPAPKVNLMNVFHI